MEKSTKTPATVTTVAAINSKKVVATKPICMEMLATVGSDKKERSA